MTTNKILVSLTVAAVFMLAGCTKNFVRDNTNQDEATEEMMTHDNLKTGGLFVQMQKNVFPIAQQPEFGDEKYQVVQNLIGDLFSGYMGVTQQYDAGGDNNTYKLLSKWYGQPFELGFTKIMAGWKAIHDLTQGTLPQIEAMARIIKVEGMHRVADMYGPLPYLNFGSGALQNNYDSQKDVYYSFFSELKAAVDTLTGFIQANPNVALMADYDYVFGGNVTSWVKFANSLRLRLAMRIVYADPAKAQAEAEAAVNHPIGVFTANTDIAQLRQSSDLSFNNPLFIISENFGDVRMGASIDSYMNGYADPRIGTYFQAGTDNTHPYRGIRMGIVISNKTSYSQGPFSKLGTTANTPILWMSAAEVYFLRAEGALRGWNMGGTAGDLYQTGITTSFDQHSAANAAVYLANSVNVPANYTDPVTTANNVNARGTLTIQWDDNSADSIKLERIITQKWIATYPDGQEAWSEFRRTGYPRLFPVKTNNSGGTINTNIQIRRIPFPPSEYQNNNKGVATGVSLLGGPDNGGTNLWWDKK